MYQKNISNIIFVQWRMCQMKSNLSYTWVFIMVTICFLCDRVVFFTYIIYWGMSQNIRLVKSLLWSTPDTLGDSPYMLTFGKEVRKLAAKIRAPPKALPRGSSMEVCYCKLSRTVIIILRVKNWQRPGEDTSSAPVSAGASCCRVCWFLGNPKEVCHILDFVS